MRNFLLALLCLMPFISYGEENKIYFELGAGMHDNTRDSYKTASKKLGHVVIGYQYDIFYGEIAHDSDLQAKDVGFDRLYLGIRKEWDL